MIGGQRLANAATLARVQSPKDLAWVIYTYIEHRPDCDPILEHAAALYLALTQEVPMKPSIGRIVHYILSEIDVEEIKRRRVAKTGEPGWVAGAQAHFGNVPTVGQHVPMIVCIVWNEEGVVNGQAFLDGNDVLWVTSKRPGTKPGDWMWPERVE